MQPRNADSRTRRPGGRFHDICPKSFFRSIRFGLMVDIGGGVPGKGADIRLGDVVVAHCGKRGATAGVWQ